MDKSRAVKRSEIKVEVTELYLPAYVIGCLFAEVLMFFPKGQGAFSPSFGWQGAYRALSGPSLHSQ